MWSLNGSEWFKGPSVLEIINSLIRHLQSSVQHGLSQHDEKLYQEALINALGEFANHLPDYQKIEIMMFIMNKVHYPLPANHTAADTLFQSILLKSLLKVFFPKLNKLIVLKLWPYIL